MYHAKPIEGQLILASEWPAWEARLQQQAINRATAAQRSAAQTRARASSDWATWRVNNPYPR